MIDVFCGRDCSCASVCLQLHDTLHRQQEEIDSLQERNAHLWQLANRAKHLASVLEVSICTCRHTFILESP